MTSTGQSYNLELEALRQEILNMGTRVEKAIDQAVKSLTERDFELARRVMEGDDYIDDLESEIEDKCIVLIATQQPLARDLRIISTGLKITTDLERVGDHAFDIAKITLAINNEPLIKPLIDIPRMSAMAQSMLKDSLQAYINLDITLAEQVCADDDAVDDLYSHVLRELLNCMIQDPTTINQATNLLFVARYLERVADHATNIAEWVIYLVTGHRMRKN